MKNLILITLFLSATQLFSQDFEIIKGIEEPVKERSAMKDFLGQDANSIYSYRYPGALGEATKDFLFQKISKKDFKTEFIKKLEINKNEVLVYKIFWGGKLYLFHSLFSKEGKLLLLKEYNGTDGSQNGTAKVAAQLNYNGAKAVYNNLSFSVAISPDTSKLMILSQTKQEGKLDELVADIYEFPKFKKLGSKKIPNTHEKSQIFISEYALSNSGKVFYRFYYMSDFTNKIVSTAIGAIPLEVQNSTVLKIPNDDKFFEGGKLKMLQDKIVFATAFKDTSNKNTEYAKAGFALITINSQNMSIESSTFDYLPHNIIDKLTYKDQFSGEAPGRKNYAVKDILILNGDFYLISNHIFSYYISGLGEFTSLKEIIVSKFNNQGEVAWSKILPRPAQAYFAYSNKIIFIYDEHHKNLENFTLNNYDPTELTPQTSIKGAVYVFASVDIDGNLERKELFTNDKWLYLNSGIIELPSSAGTKCVLLNMTNKKEDRFDLFKFK